MKIIALVAAALAYLSILSIPLKKAIAPQGPYSFSGNFTDDIQGTPDTRPGTWGTQGSSLHNLTFKPPAGFRVHILHIWGDVTAWEKNTVPGCSGFLWAVQTTAPGGSVRADYAADNTLSYVQGATCGYPSRSTVDIATAPNGLLPPDNILQFKSAIFLNTTGGPIHIEPTWTVEFQFE